MTLVIAHRGAWSDAPQNSLQALEDAIGLGCDMVELDVRRTRDGQLVVIHDARVRAALVSMLDLDELRARLVAGQAPLLQELIEAADGRIGLDVELKEDGYAQRVLHTLKDFDPGRLVLTSFLDGVLAAIRGITPEARTGLLVGPGSRRARLETRLHNTGATFLALQTGMARAGLLAWAANRELEAYVWTVNDRRVLRTLLTDERVAAVITDRPERALQIRDDQR